MKVRLDTSHYTRIFLRGGESFFLDILFHRMSAIGIYGQMTPSSPLGHLLKRNFPKNWSATPNIYAKRN
jgi:hypothetical protein